MMGGLWGGRGDILPFKIADLLADFAVFQEPANPDRLWHWHNIGEPAGYGTDELFLSCVMFPIFCSFGMAFLERNWARNMATEADENLQMLGLELNGLAAHAYP